MPFVIKCQLILLHYVLLYFCPTLIAQAESLLVSSSVLLFIICRTKMNSQLIFDTTRLVYLVCTSRFKVIKPLTSSFWKSVGGHAVGTDGLRCFGLQADGRVSRCR
jgi:hypothetical protein